MSRKGSQGEASHLNVEQHCIATAYSKSVKFLAWFAIANGVFTMAAPILFGLLLWQTLSPQQIAITLVFSLASMSAGLYGLYAKPKATFWLLFMVVFLAQVILFVQWSTVERVWMG